MLSHLQFNFGRSALVAVLLFTISFSLHSQSWTGSGPNHKNIRAVAQSPVSGNILFAAAFGSGVYKSTDGGASWFNRSQGIINTYARSILAISDNDVFVGTNDGVFKSTNGGTSWTLAVTTPNSVRDIAYDVSTGFLYAATYGANLYKSTNLGTTWTNHVVTDPVSGMTMTHLRAVEVYAPDSIYVGGSILDVASGGALFKSSDGGVTWAQVQRNIGIRSTVMSIALSRNYPDYSLIIGTASKGVYKSVNYGLNWTEINGGGTTNPMTDKNTSAVAFGTAFRYAGTDSAGDFYRRSLGDVTDGWPKGTGLPGIQAIINDIHLDNVDESKLLLATEGMGVYGSVDSGKTWQPRNTGMMGVSARDIKVITNGNVVLANGFGDGIWLSSNHATTWNTATTLTSSNSVTSLTTTNNVSILYAGIYGTGVFKTTDGGANWVVSDSTVINKYIRAVVAHPTNASIAYAGTGNGVFKTTNGGTSWVASNNGIPFSTSIRSIAIDKANPNVIYAGTDLNYLYKTSDGGSNWTNITNANGFLLQDSFIRTITVDAGNSNIVYVGSDSGRVYKSFNAGASWTLLSKIASVNSVRSIVRHPTDRRVVFAATFGSGVFVSADSGSHWLPMNDGLSDLEIYVLECDNANPINVYVGTGSTGVFHTTYSFVNQAPVLSAIGNQSLLVTQTLSLNIASADGNGTMPSLTVSGLPSGATFTDSGNGNGSFQWTPTYAQNGTYNLTFKASDGSLVDSEKIVITVTNRPPVLTAIGNKSLVFNQSLSFGVSANDPDLLTPTFTLLNKPSSASFVDNGNGTGSFSWSPTYSDIGNYFLLFIASDGVMADSEAVTVTVLDTTGSIITNISVEDGWNLASVPVGLNDMRKNSIFPSAASQAFAYESGYISKDTLQSGAGYWMKFSGNQQLPLGGAVINSDTIDVNARWNLIGGISTPLLIAQVVPVAPSSIVSSFYGFSQSAGYFSEDTLKPGKAYWVKLDQSGQLILGNTLLGKNNPRGTESDNKQEESLVLQFTDAKGRKRNLALGTNPALFNSSNELPPVPPSGVFDVRFASQRSLEIINPTNNQTNEFSLHIRGAEYPVTLSWKGSATFMNSTLSFRGITNTQPLNLRSDGFVTLQSDPEKALKLFIGTKEAIQHPTTFLLSQNYPNPFNPTTTIQYNLPQDALVYMTVHNILGEEVGQLVQQKLTAGVHTQTFDAKSLPSGVYFYRLHAFDVESGFLLFRDSKQLTLVK
ncbi:MAG: T9SS type A sorting domain-containing protein [Ignavibacteriae bacterium]|nr:T9SS type A sorting domain-containing protein [Ignavibacteriota bacterium]